MKIKTQKPDKHFKAVAGFLRDINEKGEGSKRPKERSFFEDFLMEKFQKAFNLSPDRLKLAYKLYTRLQSSDYGSELPRFDHLNFFRRGENLVIVSQPYDLDETKLSAWCKEVGASYQIANEWGFYYPGHALLFIVEFDPQAKAAFEKRRK
jgi:hypothetical protein